MTPDEIAAQMGVQDAEGDAGQTPSGPHYIKSICAWCKRELPPVKSNKPVGLPKEIKQEPISHGICRECYKKVLGREAPVR